MPMPNAQILRPNAAAVASMHRTRPPFFARTLRPGQLDGYLGCCGAKPGVRGRTGAFGSQAAIVAGPKLDVEGAAAHLEREGFAHLAAGAGTAVAGALFSTAPLVVRLGLALGGTALSILGVKKLAEGEATRQAGAQVGLTLAKCMAATIVGNIKTPI